MGKTCEWDHSTMTSTLLALSAFGKHVISWSLLLLTWTDLSYLNRCGVSLPAAKLRRYFEEVRAVWKKTFETKVAARHLHLSIYIAFYIYVCQGLYVAQILYESIVYHVVALQLLLNRDTQDSFITWVPEAQQATHSDVHPGGERKELGLLHFSFFSFHKFFWVFINRNRTWRPLQWMGRTKCSSSGVCYVSNYKELLLT